MKMYTVGQFGDIIVLNLMDARLLIESTETYIQYFLTIDSIGIKIILLFTSFSYGLCIGSFIQACVYRIPRETSIVFPPSKCPQCLNYLKWFQNIPLLGWICQLGKCIQCNNPIPLWYLIAEILLGFISLAGFYFFVYEHQLWQIYFQIVGLSAWFYLLTVIDLEYRILPDSLTVVPLGFAFVYQLFHLRTGVDDLNLFEICLTSLFLILLVSVIIRSTVKIIGLFFGKKIEDKIITIFKINLSRFVSLKTFLIGLLCAGAFYYYKLAFQESILNNTFSFILIWALLNLVAYLGSIIAKQEALGGGDIKLLSCLAYFFGLNSILIILGIMCLTAGIFGLIQLLRKKGTILPLGPFIAFSTLVYYSYDVYTRVVINL
jgi:prepilin signal peptidase PulO-like enzyme (type II secretory pathway)